MAARPLSPDDSTLTLHAGYNGLDSGGAPYRQYRLFPHDQSYLQGTFMLGLGFDL